MKKTAFIFPGQGAQYVGMGRDLVENYPIADQIFTQASEAVGYSMRSLCFEGPETELEKTENTQPAILTVSIAAMMILKEKGIHADITTGLSLGEYSALVAAESIDFQDAVPLVKARGRFMQEAVPVGVGKMAAIIGLDRDPVLKICEQCSEFGIIEPANFNSPGQIVVAGETAAIEAAVEVCKEAGAKRAVVLPVSAPFHCSMLAPAGIKLEKEMGKMEIRAPKIPIIANVSGDYVHSAEDIRRALIKQVSHSVYWEDSVRRMVDDGVDTFIEVGPGKVLSGFVKRIAKDAIIHNVEDVPSLNKLLDYWKEVC